MRTKRCTNCDCALPLTEFGRDARATSGLQSQCRACRSARVQELRLKKAAARRTSDFAAIPAAKRCPYCSKTLPSSSYSRNAAANDGLQTYCKGCYNFLYPDTRVGRSRPGRYRRDQDDCPNDGQHENKP